jgi:prevent-host-death family protein
MKKVGVRELKDNMGRYLQRVKSGERIVVTDRKKEIALLVPFPTRKGEDKIPQLIQHAFASWTGGKPTGMPSPIISKGKMVSEAVIEDRE